MQDRIESLKRAVQWGLDNGKTNMIVDLDVLAALLNLSKERNTMNCEHLDNQFQRDAENFSLSRTQRLRVALEEIINAANANPQPIHYKVKEAIDKARDAIRA